eukprot:gene4818-1800_t
MNYTVACVCAAVLGYYSFGRPGIIVHHYRSFEAYYLVATPATVVGNVRGPVRLAVGGGGAVDPPGPPDAHAASARWAAVTLKGIAEPERGRAAGKERSQPMRARRRGSQHRAPHLPPLVPEGLERRKMPPPKEPKPEAKELSSPRDESAGASRRRRDAAARRGGAGAISGRRAGLCRRGGWRPGEAEPPVPAC